MKRRLFQSITFTALCTALVFGSGALTGCAYLRDAIGLGPQRPKVHLTDIALVKATLTTLDLLLTLRVDNPNNFDLNFSKLRYDLVTADLAIAHGVFDDPVSIPASRHAMIKLPLSVDSSNAIRLAQRLLTSEDEVFAALTATADFETPLGAMSVNFEDKQPLKKLVGL